MTRPPFLRFQQHRQLQDPTPEQLVILAGSRYRSVLTTLAERPVLPPEALTKLLANPNLSHAWGNHLHYKPLQPLWRAICVRTDLSLEQQKHLVTLAASETANYCYTGGYYDFCQDEACPRFLLATNPSLSPEVVRQAVVPGVAKDGSSWYWFLKRAPLSPTQVQLLAMGFQCKDMVAFALATNPSTPPELGARLLKRALTAPTGNYAHFQSRLVKGAVPTAVLRQCPLSMLSTEVVASLIVDLPMAVQTHVWDQVRTSYTLAQVVASGLPSSPASSAMGALAPQEAFSLRDRLERARSTVDAFLEHLPSDVALEVASSSGSTSAQGVLLLSRLYTLTDLVDASDQESLKEARAAREALQGQALACVEELERLAGVVSSLSLSQDEAPSTLLVREMVTSRTQAFQELSR